MDENNKPVQPVATPDTTPAPTPTPVEPTPAAGTAASPKKKSQIIIGAIIAAILVAGAIAYGVFAYITSQPDYMLSKALEQISKQEVFAAKFNVTTGTGDSASSFTGDIAAREDKAAKTAEAVIGIGSGNNRVTITTRMFQDTTYLRLGNLANLPGLVKIMSPGQESTYETPEFKAAFDRINDKWFSLTKEEAAGFAQGATSTTATGFKPEDFQKAVEIYQKHPFFKADKTFADEAIDGVNTAHFGIKMDKPAYKAFLTELKNANLESLKPTDDDINNSDKHADDFAKNAAVEFWVARGSNKLKQVKFANTEAGSESNVVLTMLTDLPKFEKLEKPSDARSFNEFMTLFLGMPLSTGLDADSGITEEEMNQ